MKTSYERSRRCDAAPAIEPGRSPPTFGFVSRLLDDLGVEPIRETTGHFEALGRGESLQPFGSPLLQSAH